MSIFDSDEVITEYSLKQAVEDGVLVEVFKNLWKELSGGKPIVATMNIYEQVSKATYGDLERVCGLEKDRCFLAVLRRSGFIQRMSMT